MSALARTGCDASCPETHRRPGERDGRPAVTRRSETVRKEQVEMLDADGEPADGLDGRRRTDDGVSSR